MKVYLLLLSVLLSWANAQAQQFDVILSSETLKAGIGETVQGGLRIRNNDNKALNLLIRKSYSNMGSTQLVQICLNGNCAEELHLRLEAGQSTNDLLITFDAGLAAGISSARYVVINKNNQNEAVEFDVNFSVEEFAERKSIYDSHFITITDAYPNPAIESAQVDYKVHKTQPSYTIILRNLLGNVVGDYQLSALETKLKMRTDDLNAGIYFFTLYVDGEGVLTRKILVKK
jgi:Secretion system C-terminal sorting domain